jgi:uncharacterized membrane protein YagU involved in acid resistance
VREERWEATVVKTALREAKHRRKGDGPAAAIVLGGIAGVVATAAMTAVMRRLYERLPPAERYPLPPREVTQGVLPIRSEQGLRDASLIAHFAYGAAAGGGYGLLAKKGVGAGALYGVAVWALSYFGWIPAARILRPAASHPARRNALMITAHLVWGAATAMVFDDLVKARRSAFAGQDARDSVRAPRVSGAKSLGRPARRRQSRTATHGRDNPSSARGY